MKERNLFKNENGSVVVLALILLVLLTLLGIAVTRTTSIEVQVAANDEFSKIAFHNADSGTYVTPKLISDTVDQAMLITISAPPQGSISYVTRTGSSNFFRQIMGYDSWECDLNDDGVIDALCDGDSDGVVDADAGPPPFDRRDIQITLGTGTANNVVVDVQANGQQIIAGSSAEFASGAEGMGVGSTGGIALLFGMDSLGAGPWNAASNITADYRKVLGAAGGS